MCGVSVGGNRQIRLSTFFFLSLWMFVLVGFCLIGLWCNKESNTQPGRYTQPCLPCWFFFFFYSILPSSPQCVSMCVCVCVCVCVVPYLCVNSFFTSHTWSREQTNRHDSEKRNEMRLWLVGEQTTNELLCECTAQRQIQWKQLLTSLNNHFNSSETTLLFNKDHWLTASVKSIRGTIILSRSVA